MKILRLYIGNKLAYPVIDHYIKVSFMKLAEKQLAIALRKKGKSYNEIQQIIGDISKATLSQWLSNLKLSPPQQMRLQRSLEQKVNKGLIQSIKTKQLKKQEKIERIRNKAYKIFLRYHGDPFFVGGIILYWAEGAKTTESVHFMNSDARLIVYMLRWFYRFIKIKKSRIRARLYIHKIYAHENHEQFWHRIIRLPSHQFLKTIYKPTPHTVKRNPLYSGCIRIDAGGVEEFHMIKFWEELLAGKFKLMHP